MTEAVRGDLGRDGRHRVSAVTNACSLAADTCIQAASHTEENIMEKTWNVTLYRDGKPVSERRGVSESDAVSQIYLLSRTSTPLHVIEENVAPETGELQLAAA